MRGAREWSSKSKNAVFKHLMIAFFPLLFFFVISRISLLLIKTPSIDVQSFHFALSSAQNIVSLLVGFVFSFIGILLGVISFKNIQLIMRYKATKWQLGINVMAPIIIGIIALIVFVVIGATIPQTATDVDTEIIINCSAIFAAFLCSFTCTAFVMLKVINNVISDTK